MTTVEVVLEGDVSIRYMNSKGCNPKRLSKVSKRLSDILQSPLTADYTEIIRNVDDTQYQYTSSNNPYEIMDTVSKLYEKTNERKEDPQVKTVRKYRKYPKRWSIGTP